MMFSSTLCKVVYSKVREQMSQAIAKLFRFHIHNTAIKSSCVMNSVLSLELTFLDFVVGDGEAVTKLDEVRDHEVG